MAKTKLVGWKEMARKLRLLADRYPDTIAIALKLAAEAVMRTSKNEYVPVDEGTLKNSGHVEDPVRGKGREISVALVYGGPAAPYAIVQHEADFQHKVGTRKYLEKPLQLAIPTLARDMAKVLNLDRQGI